MGVIEAARTELASCVKSAVHDRTKAKLLTDAIESYVDAKIEAAINDLDDKIHKRGTWDPDY